MLTIWKILTQCEHYVGKVDDVDGDENDDNIDNADNVDNDNHSQYESNIWQSLTKDHPLH